MKRARDLATGLLLFHRLDGGRLYHSKADGYYLCVACDQSPDRDPLISELDTELTAGKPEKECA